MLAKLEQTVVRSDFDQWRHHVDKRLDSQDDTLTGISDKLDKHIESTAELKQQVTPVVDAMDTMRNGIKVMGWIGSKATAIGGAIATIVAGLAAWHNWK